MPLDNNLKDVLAPIKARPTLAARGFKYDPCAFPNAEELDQLNDPNLADDILQDLFVEYPGLDAVMDTSKSTVLLAASGGGKTATLLRLKEYLVKRRQEFSRVYQDREPTRASKWPYRPFVVVYDAFPEMPSGRLPTIEDHLPPFLNAVARDMWLIMKRHSDYPSGLYELNESERGQAKEWWWAFLRHYLLTINLDLETQPFPRLNGDWMASPNRSDPLSNPRSFLSALKLLEEKIQNLGFDSLFVLTDNVDVNEHNQSEGNPVSLIRPLLNDIALLSRQRTKFKFFLPDIFRDVVMQSLGYKRRRFDVITLAWEYDQLVDLVQRRFRWASENIFSTIDDLISAPIPSNASVERELVTSITRFHQGKPRILISLLDELLNDLEDNGFLSWDTWECFQLIAKIREKNMGISAHLIKKLRDTLKKCGPFAENAQLRRVFVIDTLSQWKDHIPGADSVAGRIDALIEYLFDKQNHEGENALVLFLRALSRLAEPDDLCRDSLRKLADELQREIERAQSDEVLEHDLAKSKHSPLDKVLIVTVKKEEAKAVQTVFSPGTPLKRRFGENQVYYELGVHGGVSVLMVQSGMGSITPIGAFSTVSTAIRELQPQAVIMCGFAFGLLPEKQKLGDILVSEQLLSYEPQTVDWRAGIIPKGDRITASDRLLRHCRSGDIDWEGAPTHFGLVLSGEKLINDPIFLSGLRSLEPKAIGGEMEGAGLYVAARQAKVDWILVKGICDWAEGNKNDDAQPLAARNAAEFVFHVIKLGGLGRNVHANT